MKYTELGNSDLNVSRICMGCGSYPDSGRDPVPGRALRAASSCRRNGTEQAGSGK